MLAPDTEAAAHALAVTKAAGSSFFWAMRTLPNERREAMYAIYAFCREVDDIADGEDPASEKHRLLEEWRAEIGRLYDGGPVCLTARALSAPVRAFGLRREDFIAVIDGMDMDVDDGIEAPSMEELETYCRRVAGAVGLLSIRAFGASQPRAEEFAIALGSALQLTNILRDVKQDAEIGRLYLPREMLLAHGIQSRDPREVLSHPALPGVCADVAAMAWARFAEAEDALAACPGPALRPAVVMMMMYRLILERLVERGWNDLGRPIEISKARKIWIAIRYGLL